MSEQTRSELHEARRHLAFLKTMHKRTEAKYREDLTARKWKIDECTKKVAELEKAENK
jgi:hypothetical protein